MRRGEVWWANLPPPFGRKPVVLVSRDEAYVIRSSITVALLTTVIRNIPTEVRLDKEDGLPKTCVVNLDNVYTFRKNIFKQRITLLKSEKITQINLALRFALGL